MTIYHIPFDVAAPAWRGGRGKGRRIGRKTEAATAVAGAATAVAGAATAVAGSSGPWARGRGSRATLAKAAPAAQAGAATAVAGAATAVAGSSGLRTRGRGSRATFSTAAPAAHAGSGAGCAAGARGARGRKFSKVRSLLVIPHKMSRVPTFSDGARVAVGNLHECQLATKFAACNHWNSLTTTGNDF